LAVANKESHVSPQFVSRSKENSLFTLFCQVYRKMVTCCSAMKAHIQVLTKMLCTVLRSTSAEGCMRSGCFVLSLPHSTNYSNCCFDVNATKYELFSKQQSSNFVSNCFFCCKWNFHFGWRLDKMYGAYQGDLLILSYFNLIRLIQNATNCDTCYDLGAMLSTVQHITPVRYRRMLKYVWHDIILTKCVFKVLNFIVAIGSFTLSVYGS